MMIALIVLILSVGYFYALYEVRKTWTHMKEVKLDVAPRSISVVVAFRNEELYLKRLLNSLESLSYPRDFFEIVLVNDHSTDGSVGVIGRLIDELSIDVCCYSLENGVTGKKEAIEFGVKKSKYTTIVTTDADCVVGKQWLHSVNECCDSDFVSSPVAFLPSERWFSSFVELDFLSLICLGGVLIEKKKPLLANGANMAFNKVTFEEIGGYSDNKKYSSGDDVFLLASMFSAKKQIVFNKSKDAIVKTQMPTNLVDFFHQRIRWAKKTKHIESLQISPLVTALLLAYVGFVITPFLLLYSQTPIMVVLVSLSWTLKLVADYRFFRTITAFYDRRDLVKQLWWVEILHPFYVVVVGIFSLFVPYKWKLRSQRNG